MSNNQNQNQKFNRERRIKRKELAQKILGNWCAECGDTGYLEFDHIDRRTKTREMSSALVCSEIVFLEELAKCQLLCKPCHIKKSSKEASEFSNKERTTTKIKHGTLTGYKYYKCRCDLCKEKNALSSREHYKTNGWYLNKKDTQYIKNHGTAYAYYRYSCRCISCEEAYIISKKQNAERMRIRRQSTV